MSHKVNALNAGWMGGKTESRVRKEAVLAVLISAAVLLVAAGVWALLSVARPEVSSGVAAGVDASSARWAALGTHYTRDYDTRDYGAIAAVSSARWSALGAYYLARCEAAAAASSARYQALAGWYAGQVAQGK